MTDDRWAIDTTGIAPERGATAGATPAGPESADEALARATIELIDRTTAWTAGTPIIEATQRSQRR